VWKDSIDEDAIRRAISMGANGWKAHLKGVVANRAMMNIWKTLILWKGVSIDWTIG
jgi:hypothetical protein